MEQVALQFVAITHAYNYKFLCNVTSFKATFLDLLC